MRLLAIALTFVLAGCSSTTNQYYEAVEKAAQANAAASQAKFEALSKIASAGDGQAASAAVMALALTQTPSVTPIRNSLRLFSGLLSLLRLCLHWV